MVKCANCGFLAMRERRTRLLAEVELDARTSGRALSVTVADAKLGEDFPICFVMAHPLLEETCAFDPRNPLSVIQKDRKCESFCQWQQGYTPKEHREMLSIKEEREWRERQANKEEAWRQKQAAEDRQWREKEAQAAERRHRRELLVLGFLAIGVQIAVAIVVAVIAKL
jgi:hypothetical protein